jgi:hypothetical protein
MARRSEGPLRSRTLTWERPVSAGWPFLWTRPGHLVHGRGEEKETIPGAFGAASFFLLAVDQVP